MTCGNFGPLRICTGLVCMGPWSVHHCMFICPVAFCIAMVEIGAFYAMSPIKIDAKNIASSTKTQYTRKNLQHTRVYDK